MDKAPKVRLLGDRLLVIVKEQEETVTPSGIILPKALNKDSDTNATYMGEVILTSSAIKDPEVIESDKVYEGENVLVSKYAGTDLEFEGITYKIIRITDVIGAIE